MFHIGLDAHKNGSVYCCVDNEGKVVSKGSLSHTREEVARMLSGAGGGECRVALEASGSWQHVAALLAEQGAEVVLSHPRRTKAIASAKVKTDAIDARTLADLLRTGLLPESHIPAPELQQARRLVRARQSLVSTRTRCKSQARAMLRQAGLSPPVSDAFGKAGRRWLAELELSDADRLLLDSWLSQIDQASFSIDALEREIHRRLRREPAYRALRALPGFKLVAAAVFLAEVGNARRFKRARHLLSYLGLVPRVRSSAGRTKHGRLTKEGPPLARNMLVQAAEPATRKDPSLKEVYERKKATHGSQVARIEVARKLATRAFHACREIYD